jgi:hypothetical protein
MSRRAGLSREEACRTLGITPSRLRALWSDFGPVLGGGELPRRLSPETVERLKVADRLLAQGRDRDQVLAVLAGGATWAEVASAREEEDLHALLADIRERLRENEQRRAQDHDRLLMTLVRTQQELSHLRYEVAASVPRRERRRRQGFWARLFGPPSATSARGGAGTFPAPPSPPPAFSPPIQENPSSRQEESGQASRMGMPRQP